MFFSITILITTRNSKWEILVLTMKNFDIFGVHSKIRFLVGVGEGGGVELMKNQYRVGSCLVA